MTVQKSSTAQERKKLEEKMLADVAKAQKNVENYGYSDRLEFFYSYPLTEDFIEKDRCRLLQITELIWLFWMLKE